jgi:hypothetical protein
MRTVVSIEFSETCYDRVPLFGSLQCNLLYMSDSAKGKLGSSGSSRVVNWKLSQFKIKGGGDRVVGLRVSECTNSICTSSHPPIHCVLLHLQTVRNMKAEWCAFVCVK